MRIQNLNFRIHSEFQREKPFTAVPRAHLLKAVKNFSGFPTWDLESQAFLRFFRSGSQGLRIGKLPIILTILVGSFFLDLTSAPREVRYLTFSVENQYEFFVRDLKLEEVELRLDDQPVEIGFLASSDIDTATVILLENSPRTAKFAISLPNHGQINLIDKIRYQMAYDFFGPLTQMGPVLLGEFFKKIEILQDFSTYPDLLNQALLDLKPKFAEIDMDFTRVGLALGRGVDLLRNRPEKRKVLILFAASIDRDSYNNLEEYQEMLRLTDIELYAITNAPRFAGATDYTFEERMSGYFLRNLVSETSGYAYVIKEFAYYDELFTDLKGRVANTYTIGFYVEPGPERKEHKVDLRITREKSKVSCRKTLVY